MRIGITGATGFIGSRLLELFHLTQRADVRPVVRSFGSLARVARFDLDWRVADARQNEALRLAFEGCPVVIHCVVGDANVIVESARAAYQAAEQAGVKRLIYLSSASVHGQNPPPGVDETTPLRDDQPIGYNNAKVQAERELMRLRERGSVEVVILRPGIVYGPRSRWIVGTAEALLDGTAYLLQEGGGVCNAIYVDNLVHAIDLAMTQPGLDCEIFLVGDQERVTWADIYRSLSDALGLEFAQIPRLPTPGFRRTWKQRAAAARSSELVQAFLPLLPAKLKRAAKAGISSWNEAEAPSPWLPSHRRGPVVTLEMAMLQSCSYQLPWSKAAERLGYRPQISFAEGSRRSLEWLSFVGYPVKTGAAER